MLRQSYVYYVPYTHTFEEQSAIAMAQDWGTSTTMYKTCFTDSNLTGCA